MTATHYLVKAVSKAPSQGRNVMNYSISSISIKVFAAIVAFASLSAASSAQIEQKTVSANVPFKFETAS